MEKKLIRFTEELTVSIQEYADCNTGGNFSMAVRQLIELGLLV